MLFSLSSEALTSYTPRVSKESIAGLREREVRRPLDRAIRNFSIPPGSPRFAEVRRPWRLAVSTFHLRLRRILHFVREASFRELVKLLSISTRRSSSKIVR
jgi:hypothetical protein